MILFALLMTALTVVGAYISISLPFSPVPITMSNLFVILGGLVLGKKWGLLSTVLYLLLGAIGLPVLAGGEGGIAHFFGPTGGYLIGFAVAAFAVGSLVEIGESSVLKDALAVVAGYALIFTFGVPWLMYQLDFTFGKALTAGVFPFLPGAVFKGIVAVGLAKLWRPISGSLLANKA